jgi:ribosome biogenesis GTPase
MTTRLFAVGDEVEILPVSRNEAAIENILPRRSKLSRRNPFNIRKEQIIAANVDCLTAVQSAVIHKRTFSEIDRCLLIGEINAIPCCICINKIDLVKRSELREYKSLYQPLGYQIFFTSAITMHGIERLKTFLLNKTSVFIGQTGVGKSALLNSMNPSLNLKVQEVNPISGRGRHTTTWFEMVDIGGGYVIDTPGLEFITLWGIDHFTLKDYFPEFQNFTCKFNNCLHIDEIGCKVKRAVKKGKISLSRYTSYMEMFDELQHIKLY